MATKIAVCINVYVNYCYFFAVKLQLQSVGTSKVRIFSKQTCLYVAMAANGKVYTAVSGLVSLGKKYKLSNHQIYRRCFFCQSQAITVLFLIRIDANTEEWRHLNKLINICFLCKTNERMFSLCGKIISY